MTASVPAAPRPADRRRALSARLVVVAPEAVQRAWCEALQGDVVRSEPTRFDRPQAALEWLLHNEADLVLLADAFGDQGAADLVRAIRRDGGWQAVPLVGVLLGPASAPAQHLYEAGCMAVLPRPDDLVSLRGAVRNLLGLRTRLRTLNEANQRLLALATTDALTGVYNRRTIFDLLEREVSASRRYRHPLTLAMVDADAFKDINDTHGHAVGDEVLRQLARTLVSELRDVDLVGRIGGEEFLLGFPRTPMRGAMVVAERVRAAIAASAVDLDGQLLHYTVSIGVAERGEVVDGAPPVEGLQDLVQLADARMYAAKAAGRDAVVGLDP